MTEAGAQQEQPYRDRHEDEDGADPKDRHPSAEWQLILGKRSREINDAAFRLLDKVKEEALEAQRQGDEDKVKALQARVASWGVERFAKDLRAALDK